MIKSPLITVIIGTYNPKNYLIDALNSIFSQSYKNIEVVLYNDGSNQNESNKNLRLALDRYPQIKYIHSDENKGLSHALNECIYSSKGEYILRMDDDDYSLPNRIQLQYEFLKSNKDCDYVGSSAYMFDEKIYGFINVPESPSIEDVLQSRAFIHPSIMIKRKTLIDIGNYSSNPNVLRIEDMDLWFRLMTAGKKGRNINVPLLLYRENLNSISKRTIKFRIREFKFKISKSIEMNLGFVFITRLIFKFVLSIFIPQRLYKVIRRHNYLLKHSNQLYSTNDLNLQIQLIVNKVIQ